MRFVHSASITLIARGLALPIGIASSIITARTLGPEGRGVLAALMVLQGLAIQFGTLGYNGSITYFLSHEPGRARNIVGNSVWTAIGGGMLVAAVFAAAGAMAPQAVLGTVEPRLFRLLLASLPFTFLSQFLQNVLVARQSMLAFNLLDLLVRTTLLSAYAVVLLGFGLGTDAAIWSFAGVSAVGGLLYLFVIYRRERFTLAFDRPLFGQMFGFGSRIYAASILSYLVLRLNMLIINPVLGERDAGLFSVVLLFMDLVALVPQTLGLILFPAVARDNEGSALLTAKVFRFTLYGVGALCVVIAIAAQPLIRLMFGDEFAAAAPALQWLAPGILAMALMTILNNDLAGRGMPAIVIATPAVAVACSALLHRLLLSPLGLVGSSVATSGAFIVAVVQLYFAAFRRLGLSHRAWWLLDREDLATLRPSNLLRKH
jgi:O-antigen/teichoic acid export membrane protein